MKKIIALVFVLALLLAPSAFALMCTQSQSLGDSDACWTEVAFSPSQTVAVSAGTVLVYDYASGQLTDSATSPAGASALKQAGSWFVIPATVSKDANRVAGVLQVSVDSNHVGQPMSVLTRGYGDIFVTGNVSSGDALFVAVATNSTKGTVGNIPESTSGYGTSIATALETTTANGKAKAYIHVQ